MRQWRGPIRPQGAALGPRPQGSGQAGGQARQGDQGAKARAKGLEDGISQTSLYECAININRTTARFREPPVTCPNNPAARPAPPHPAALDPSSITFFHILHIREVDHIIFYAEGRWVERSRGWSSTCRTSAGLGSSTSTLPSTTTARNNLISQSIKWMSPVLQLRRFAPHSLPCGTASGTARGDEITYIHFVQAEKK